MSKFSKVEISAFLKACMVLKATADKAGLRRSDVFVLLEPDHFERLMKTIKAGLDDNTGCRYAMLVNGFPIFKSDTSKEDREAFLRDAGEKLSRLHSPGHG